MNRLGMNPFVNSAINSLSFWISSVSSLLQCKLMSQNRYSDKIVFLIDYGKRSNESSEPSNEDSLFCYQ